MDAGLEILCPHLKHEENEVRRKVVIGVVEGDTHDIGKNLVKIMLEASGFETVDLGRDIPPQRFVDEAIKVQASVIALSTLMTTTMDGMAHVNPGGSGGLLVSGGYWCRFFFRRKKNRHQ